MIKEVRTRFAPSPTGFLHVGNLQAALYSFLQARKFGGRFFLRIDDTDITRSKDEYVIAIKRDLEEFGIYYDETFKQSSRMANYRQAAEILRNACRLYPCFETQEELDFKRKSAIRRGKPPVYDRSALKLTGEEISEFAKQGVQPHWRFKLADKRIEWFDKITGEVSVDCTSLSDPILFKSDGTPIFTIASVVDDFDYQISHVIRGNDHLVNTAVHIQIAEALGYTLPEFAHYPLIRAKEGEYFSKRDGSGSLRSWLDQGVDPRAILSILGRSGTSLNVHPIDNINELLSDFDLANFNSGGILFSSEDVWRMNRKIWAMTDADYAKKHFPRINASLWNLIKGMVNSPSEVQTWIDIAEGKLINLQDKDLAAVFQKTDFDGDVAKFINQLQKNFNLPKRDFFYKLRLFISGQSQGPALFDLLHIIGIEKIKSVVAELDGISVE